MRISWKMFEEELDEKVKTDYIEWILDRYGECANK